MHRKKAQSAMEYLMTYGWAILIISISLAALFQLGVFNPMSFAPKAPPGSCQVFRPNGPGTTQFINLEGICNGEMPQYVASFDGVNSYVSLPNPLPSTVCSATITAWSYDAGMNSSGAMGGVVSGWGNGWMDIEYNDGDLRFELRNSSAWIGVYISGNYKDKWLFTALVLDNGQPYAYINNTLVWASSAKIGCIGLPNWRIGVWDRDFNGSIANVQIYNTSLSANQIQALYQEGIGGAPIDLNNLAGWWPLNGDAKDYSGNGNNGQTSNVGFTSNWWGSYTPP